MNREKLSGIATAVLDWINAPQVDTTIIATLVSPTVSVPYPQPGTKGSYEGLIELTQKCHDAFPDYKMVLQKLVIDVSESTAVLLVNLTGTHTGYWAPRGGK